MKISVILTTARWGGFDVLHHSMINQTMPHEDFEVVVADELYEHRKDALKLHRLNVKHTPPHKHVDIYDNSTGFNSALRVAEGDLVVFAVDFMWMPADYLQRHWDCFTSNPGWSLSGYLDRYKFPPLCLDGDRSYLIFEDLFDARFAERWFRENEPVYRERKGGAGIVRQDGKIEMPGEKIYLIPDSIPMSVLKELNGLDEMYNGAYGVNDIDVGVRANMLGHRFMLDPRCVAFKLGVPGVSEKIPGVSKPKVRLWEDNYEMFKERIKAINDGREGVAVPDRRGAWR